MAETVYILLGTNMGDRESYLESALERLEELEGMEVIATSAVYISEARDVPGEQPSFLNQVVKGDYWYKPIELLNALQRIELDLGRTDKGENKPRTIDLDILLFGELEVDTDRLRVPHSGLLERPFAMVPLLQIDPQLRHPVNKQLISEFLTDTDREKVIIFKDHVARNI